MGKKKVVCINGQRYHSYYQKQNLDVLLLENKLPFASLPLGCGHSGVNQAAQVSRNVESALQVEHFLFQIPFIPDDNSPVEQYLKTNTNDLKKCL